MVGAVVDVHVLDETAAKTVLGQHAFHDTDEQRVHAGLEMLVERFAHQYLGGELTLTAGIAGVVEIDVVGHLFAGENHFVGVDDDHVVAALGVGSVAGFVFPAQNLGYLRAETAEVKAGGIDEHPFVLNLVCAGGNGLVT